MLSRVEELRLISRCVLADDRHAFGVLVDAYQERLRRFLLNLTLGDEFLTDDLAQETFIKAYLGLRSFKGMAGFGTWLFRIAYNEFYSHKRNSHNALSIENAAADLPAPDLNAGSDAAHDIQVAMAALTDIERVVVTLFYIDDMPLKKITAVTGLNSSTVRSHLHRAREKMRKTLDVRL